MSKEKAQKIQKEVLKEYGMKVLPLLVNRGAPEKKQILEFLETKESSFRINSKNLNELILFYIHSGRLSSIKRASLILSQISPRQLKVSKEKASIGDWETNIPFFFHSKFLHKTLNKVDSNKFDYKNISEALLEENVAHLFFTKHSP